MSDMIENTAAPAFKQPREMHQPTKPVLRDALRCAADRIEAQAAELERLRAELADTPVMRYVGIGLLIGICIGAWVFR